ncbi:MAG: hypothetical protein PWQ17_826 [Anaerophaga sp.]|uniref:hypothetical protein n=1 Tax=Anaerophaga thermohalophila TaxID=177400 RepID=UPI0011124425|nr:hypothetical protein [Anaerophaga thermohalophila]MDK2841321.1 hypothetical protein [Anaerophaga sp.]
MLNYKYLLFTGLALVLLGIGLLLTGFEWYHYILIPGIGLKVAYLVIGLLNGTLAAGRYLAMLFGGIAMVGGGGYLKRAMPGIDLGHWLIMSGFLLKAVSIVFMVVVGRRRMRAERELTTKP